MTELRAVTFDFWGTLFQWNDGNAEIRRAHVRAFVARHRADLGQDVVDAAFEAGVEAQAAHWKEARHFGPESVIDHLLAELRLEAPPGARAELRELIEDRTRPATSSRSSERRTRSPICEPAASASGSSVTPA